MKNFKLKQHPDTTQSKYFLENSQSYFLKPKNIKQKLLNLLTKQTQRNPNKNNITFQDSVRPKKKGSHAQDYLKNNQLGYQKKQKQNLKVTPANINMQGNKINLRQRYSYKVVSNTINQEYCKTNRQNQNVNKKFSKSPLKVAFSKSPKRNFSPNMNYERYGSPINYQNNSKEIDSLHFFKSPNKTLQQNKNQLLRKQKQQKARQLTAIYQKIQRFRQNQKKISQKQKSVSPENKIKRLKSEYVQQSKTKLKTSYLDNGTSNQNIIKTNVNSSNSYNLFSKIHHHRLHSETQVIEKYHSKVLQLKTSIIVQPKIQNFIPQKKIQMSKKIDTFQGNNDLFRKKSSNETEITNLPPESIQLKKKRNIYQENIKNFLIDNTKQKLNIRDFQLGKSKGQGKFGKVYCVKHIASHTIYALKKISKKQIRQNFMQQQLVLQIKLQYFFNHPNILKLYTFFDDKQFIYLILEYMQEGTLYQNIKRNKQKKLCQMQVSRRISEIANAIGYLHDLNVAHRDIKPQNIVLSYNTGKLCDFGWSTICSDRRKTYCGTFDYVAPEIMQGKQYDQCVDLWCLGVLTYELIVGKVPFYDVSRKQTIKKILSIEKNQLIFPHDLSNEAKDFIECLIKKEPDLRKRAKQLMQHKFLTKYSQMHLYQ